MIVLVASGVAFLLLCGICGIIGIFAEEPKPETQSGSQPVASQPVATEAAAPAATTPAAVATEPATSLPTPTTPAAPAKVKMPNLVGKNAAVAEDELRALGFTRIDFGSEDEEDTFVILRANWTVTKQSTKAGASVPIDKLIVLTCTKKRN